MEKNPQPLTQKLSPNDIKNKEFTRTVWGYAPKEVVEFLDETAKTWEKVQKQEKDLIDRIQSLSDELLRWKAKETELERLRERALQDAQAVREEAQREAEKHFAAVEERANGIRVKTEEWLERVIAEVSETERQKSNFMTAFKSALDSHYALLRTEQDGGEPLTAKLDNFLKTTLGNSSRIS